MKIVFKIYQITNVRFLELKIEHLKINITQKEIYNIAQNKSFVQ